MKMNELAPVGVDYKMDIAHLLSGYGGIIFLIIVGYFSSYYNQYSKLFRTEYGEEVVRDGAMMEPFLDMFGGYSIVACYCLVLSFCLLMAGHYYLYHTKGSQSIYLMRRLPNRWELHRRCLAVPLLVAIFALLTMALLTFCCYQHYLLVTPVECLYPNHWGSLRWF